MSAEQTTQTITCISPDTATVEPLSLSSDPLQTPRSTSPYVSGTQRGLDCVLGCLWFYGNINVIRSVLVITVDAIVGGIFLWGQL